MSDKIINTFQQRRQLEQAFSDLATTTSDRELREAAKNIAHTFDAAQVLNALIKRLDSPSSQVRGGLGHIAGLLDPDEVLPALRNVAANRSLPPQARLTAASIAHRYIGAELPHVLLADLNDTAEIAFQSLREALDEARYNRHVLLEYVEQMQEHPEEIAWLVMDLLDRVVPEERVELLRLIAQDTRDSVAKGALGKLDALAVNGVEGAARALHTLSFALDDDLAAQAERSERKARFGGHAYLPPPTDGWRALLSSADPNGAQSVWLLRRPLDDDNSGVLLGFIHNELLGITHFFGTETLDKTLLPKAAPLGQPVTVTMDNGHKAAMLEIPFDYGRWLLRQALLARRKIEPQEDRPGEYKLYNDLIWQFVAPVATNADWPHWQYHTESAEQAATLTDEAREAITDRLLQHPLMEHWQLHNWTLLPAAQEGTLPPQELVTALLRQMERSGDGVQLAQALAAGLRAQASWLYLAEERELAEQCGQLATALPHLPMPQNPVLARMLTSALLRRTLDE
ncbi:MAG TPA: hypothetical protein P5121_00975 [Caldilineaceae bacterium]|nr:hypothetical protein [Caldilineaceae bacterium]